MSVTGRLIFVGVVVSAALGATSSSLGQTPPPTCSAAVMGRPVFSAADLDERAQRSTRRHHTIQVTADLSDTVLDGSVTFSLPAAVAVVRPHGEINAGPYGVMFVAENTGQVPVAASWTQDDQNGGTCRGTASTTLRLQPATRMPRLRNVLADEHQHSSFRFGLDWRFGVDLGRRADLDPVTVMARGVRQSRLPGARVPFKKITVPMRVGDPRFNDAAQSRVDVPRWRSPPAAIAVPST